MSPGRSIGHLLAVVALVVAARLPDSAFASALRYTAVTYIMLDLVIQAWVGYRRRRPHWTRESWRRFAAACVVPLGALLITIAMMLAVEWKLSIVGEPRSALRAFWAVGVLLFMFIGVGGLMAALGWLTTGDAARQFQFPWWLRWRRGGGDAA